MANSASPAPETGALRDAIERVLPKLASGNVNTYEANQAADILHAALHTGGEGKGEICQCELSGLIHLIKDGKGCELCDPKDRQPFTRENVDKAFKWYAQQLENRPSPKEACRGDTCARAATGIRCADGECDLHSGVWSPSPTPAPATGDMPAPEFKPLDIALAFFPSVIRSGENWTETCERVRADAYRALDGIKAILLRAPSQPPVPPAADAEGWWVKPTWKHGAITSDLFLNGVAAGYVYQRAHGVEWNAWDRLAGADVAHGLPTRKAAQAALLAAVRLKAMSSTNGNTWSVLAVSDGLLRDINEFVERTAKEDASEALDCARITPEPSGWMLDLENGLRDFSYGPLSPGDGWYPVYAAPPPPAVRVTGEMVEAAYEGAGRLISRRLARDALTAALAVSFPIQQDWQTIATAPKDGTRIILGNGAKVTYGYWGDFMGRGAQWLTVEPTQWISAAYAWPTHWQPLPAPPGSQDADDGRDWELRRADPGEPTLGWGRKRDE